MAGRVTQYRSHSVPAETSAETCRPACTIAMSQSVQKRREPVIGLSSAAVAIVVADNESGIMAFRACNAPSLVLDSAGVSPKTPQAKVALSFRLPRDKPPIYRSVSLNEP